MPRAVSPGASAGPSVRTIGFVVRMSLSRKRYQSRKSHCLDFALASST